MSDTNGGLGIYSAANGTIVGYVHASDDPGGIRRLVRPSESTGVRLDRKHTRNK